MPLGNLSLQLPQEFKIVLPTSKIVLVGIGKDALFVSAYVFIVILC